MLAVLSEHLPAPLSAVLSKPVSRQLVRYVVAGLAVTQFAALIYSLLVVRLELEPLLANVVSTVCGVCAGYVVHSRWSFASGAAGSEHGKMLRFAVSTLVAFLFNSLAVWLLASRLHLSPLLPVPVMMFVTPWISFLVNRHWVFKAA